MDEHELKELLAAVKEGKVGIEEAALSLKAAPYEDLGYAKTDLHRTMRQGVGEVIYGQGKTAAQIAGVANSLLKGGGPVLITRLSPEKAAEVSKEREIDYDPVSKTGVAWGSKKPERIGSIVVATGGTSDIPVAEEAARTAETFGNSVARLYDVGVAGLHRTLSHLRELMEANVVVAIAGMEGALASVIGGLCSCPVIAVPTSVGYGANFQGLSALLSMLNSCASGVSVVNIDNGFGAGYIASLINHMQAKSA
jgi:NCAIR mutase (PurE)-related protein